MRNTWRFILISLIFGSLTAAHAEEDSKWDVLTPKEQIVLNNILAHWETWMPARKEAGTAPLINFEELYQGLSQRQMDLLERIRAIDPRDHFGFEGNHLGSSMEDVSFKRLDDQWIRISGQLQKIEPQYLPFDIYQIYEKMMASMQKDLGRRLYVESGFRSPAYQLYTFVFYMPKRGYSLVKTGQWVALPGYSEHGAVHRQAIDFINEEGINGEDDVEAFERLPEYQWLEEHAAEYGFVLSYPRGQTGITFEPWHWSYRKELLIESKMENNVS